MRVRNIFFAALLILLPSQVLAGQFDGLKTADNPAHTPLITAPDTVKVGEPFQVTITLGAKPHPSDSGHFIRFIALYAGDVELGRTTLTPTLTRPTVTYTLTLSQSTTLRALAAPNHSAAWVSEHPITVTH